MRLKASPALKGFNSLEDCIMHNHDDTYAVRPGFEPGTSRLQAPVDKKEESFYLELCYFKFRELDVLETWELEVPGTLELGNFGILF